MVSSFWLPVRQLRAILWKNLLLKYYSPLSTLVEIFMPVGFMFLLAFFKTLSNFYDSPPIMYDCGQTYPWQYAQHVSELPLQCLLPSDTCDPPQGSNKYYQGRIKAYSDDDDPPTLAYGQLGFTASAVGAGWPLYALQVGDESDIYLEGYVPGVPFTLGYPSPSFINLMKMLQRDTVAGVDYAKVAVLPQNSDDPVLVKAATDLFDYLSQMLDSTDALPNEGHLKDNLRLYESEKALESFVRGDDYDDPANFHNKIAFAVVVNAVDVGANDFDYTIRSNYTFPWETSMESVACLGSWYRGDCSIPFSSTVGGTGETFSMPTTNNFVDEISRPQVSTYFYAYAYTGFLSVQKVVDEYFLSLAQLKGDPENILTRTGMPTVTTQVSMGMFPTAAYTANDFQQTIASLLPIFYMLAFLFPFSRFIRGLVLEKEEKIKEGMKIMGLSDAVYGLSWFITLTTQIFVTSVAIVLATQNSVFEYSEALPIFMYFFLFGVSVVMFSFLLATFFSKSKSAAILGSLLFFATYFPYYAVADASMSTGVKILTSLLSPSAFALGAGVLANWEAGQIGVNSVTVFQTVGNYSFFTCLFMMSLDAVLYGVLAWYFDKILPSEYGTQLPWYFPFSRLKHCCCCCFFGCNRSSGSSKNADALEDELSQSLLAPGERLVERHSASGKAKGDSDGPREEAVHADLTSQIGENRSVSIRRLRKVFKTTGEDRVAVDELNLDLFEGQITVLLGHNGAGKSTTISMLTGLINSSSGDAIVRGLQMTKAMPEIRRSMGVCPQHDVLFPELTVAQHLRMFATFKDVQPDKLESEVTKIIAEVGLTEKANVPSRMLSGGMKRKLSVGIALIGDSKVVILDEPTSGMDPFSRRSTWNILQKNKQGRVILLTTHFMDEADILGDRIAIMAHGQLKCVGSSMFLKNTYGVGYTFTIVRENSSTERQAKDIDQIVRSFIPQAEVLNMVGAEQSYRLPFSASKSFVALFEKLEEGKKSLGLSSYGISVTTLEEVFIRVGKGTEDPDDRRHLNSIAADTHANASERASLQAGKTEEKSLAEEESAFYSQRLGRVSEKRVFFTHTKALLKKRLIYGMRDKKSFCFQLVIPTILVLLGMILLTVRNNADQPSLVLGVSSDKFNTDLKASQRNPIPFYIERMDGANGGEKNPVGVEMVKTFSSNNPNLGQAYDVTDDADGAADQFYGCAAGPAPLQRLSNYLLDSPSEQLELENGATRYGAVTISKLTSDTELVYNIMVNASTVHGPGVFMNLVNNAYLQSVTDVPTAKLTTRNHPLPKTQKETNATQTADAFTAALMVMIAFCFLPASYAIFVVKEREVKAKHQQVISGVSIYAYWFSTWLWDAVSYLAPFSLTLVLIYAFGIEAYTTGDGALGCAMLFLLFGPAVSGFTYMTSFIFTSHSTAQNIILFQNFITGLCLMITSFILGLFDNTRIINLQLKCFYRLFPGFCLGDGLIQLTLCKDGKCPVLTKDGYSPTETQGVFAWDVVGGDLLFLFCEVFAYLLITMAIEYSLSFPWFTAWLSRIRVKDPGNGNDNEADDVDVAAERSRVANGEAVDDIVVLDSLRKVYPSTLGPKVAVQSLSFGIPNGECFGFLGINGAGKSTTLSILSGEYPATSGDAFIAGYDIKGDQSLIRRKIGYCPQFDALLELLTVEEHLNLYARIKGVPASLLKGAVHTKMTQMDLLDFANKAAGSLSGGNKRKLSVAIAMIGGPSIVFLDEPSTGMDPVARRFMWDVISKMSTKDGQCSVILTTHSMEEAEALCSRIGIMVNGRLRCLGSGQHLKARHGNGFEIDIKMENPSAEAACDAFAFLARSGALPVDVFAGIPPEIRSRIDVQSNSLQPIYKDRAEAASIVSYLHSVRISSKNLQSMCSALGHRERSSLIAPGGSGDVLHDMLTASGGTLAIAPFLEWWLTEDIFSRITDFMTRTFAVTSCIERSTIASCRWSVSTPQMDGALGGGAASAVGSSGKGPNPNPSLPFIFGKFEEARGGGGGGGIGISEYSVGQTTLEQIFNQFAGSSYNPEMA